VRRALDLLYEVRDIVEREAGPEVTQIPRVHLESPLRRRTPLTHQPAPERVVNDVTKRSSRPTRFSLELRGNVFIERKRRAYAVTLLMRHHDGEVGA
jgi:hypothetical protein